MNLGEESARLLEEARNDIKEFGLKEEVAVWYICVDEAPVITNYDFFNSSDTIKFGELRTNEAITKMTLENLLKILVNQNEV